MAQNERLKWKQILMVTKMLENCLEKYLSKAESSKKMSNQLHKTDFQ